MAVGSSYAWPPMHVECRNRTKGGPWRPSDRDLKHSWPLQKYKPGVETIHLIFSDQPGVRVFQFPWYQRYARQIEPILEQVCCHPQPVQILPSLPRIFRSCVDLIVLNPNICSRAAASAVWRQSTCTFAELRRNCYVKPKRGTAAARSLAVGDST